MFSILKNALLFSKYLIWICYAGVVHAQTNQWDIKLSFSGEITLFNALDSLRYQGVNIVYSVDKLTNKSVKAKKGITVRQYFDYLEQERVVDLIYENDQVIVRPYVLKSYTMYGVLKDTNTGEHIIGANIEVIGKKSGTNTNGYGYYSLTLREGDYKLRFSHVGYQSHELSFTLIKNTYFDISLSQHTTQLEEIEVLSISAKNNLNEIIPSVNYISTFGGDGQIPYFLGEVDVVQNGLLKPGIRALGEDASGIHVRGGNVDQNLTLLDEATIYNPNHFYGLISIFNPEAVNNVRIMKSYIPPSYGGRSSSVLEVRQKEGNANKTSVSGGIGVLSARILLEGPIHRGKSSFLISGRQSLLNFSIDDFASTSFGRGKIRFQDINLKLNFKYSQASTYYLSGYLGNDRNTAGFNSTRNWGNRMLNFRWNYLFTPKLFSHISAFYTEYNYKIENTEGLGTFISRSKIADTSVKVNLTSDLSLNNEISYGFSFVYHRLIPGVYEPLNQNTNTDLIKLEDERGIESALFINHQTKFKNFILNYGMRFSGLHILGSGTVYQYKDGLPLSDSTITDTLTYGGLDVIDKTMTFEPRVSVNWRLNENTSIKTSYSRTAQYLRLISNTISPTPSDIWKLSNRYIPPSITDQYTIGVYKNLHDNMWELSSEVYYKKIGNNIQYKDGADLIFNENVETELLLNDARTYGIELYARKRYGKLKGWISYTFSRAESRIIKDNEERYVLAYHDKTHDFSTSWNMDVLPRLNASANFVLNTGIPITLPTDKYEFEGNVIPHFQVINNSRLPIYHRLDISLKWKGKEYKKDGSKKKNNDFWVLTLYNVYSRKNIYSYFYRESPTDPGRTQVDEYSIFRSIIPAVTYNFRF